MKKSVIAATILILTLISASISFAGDFSLYSKAGVMDWAERAEGKQYMRETGPIQEIGVHGTISYGDLDLDLSAGTWMSQFYYRGVILETQRPIETVTADIGFKGYAGVSMPVPVTDSFTMAPMAGIAHDSFLRPACGELWFVLGAKAGAIAKYEDFDVKAGIQYPFFTADISWPMISGVKDPVVMLPKGRISPFMEGTYKINDRWTAGFYVDMWRWAASNQVSIKYVGSNSGSALAKNGKLYQPDTKVMNSGISLAYHF